MRQPSKALAVFVLIALAGVFAGCTDPYTHPTSTPTGQEVQNPGEPPAPPPTQASAEPVDDAQPTPRAALERFARLYANWTYRTLTHDQQALAAIAVGPVRLAEQQAVAASHVDGTIRRAHVANRGQLLAVSLEMTRPGWWVIVTREQTTGNGEYEALPASDHVVLAQVARVPGGWAVSQWQPQD